MEAEIPTTASPSTVAAQAGDDEQGVQGATASAASASERAANEQEAGEGSPSDPGELDGRRRRARRSREGVIAAILDLVREGHERPTTAEIAERSGVSVRSVFRHFDDVESLYAEALAVHGAQIAHLYDLPPLPDPLHERIDALVLHRIRLFESTAPVRRMAERLRSRSAVIAESLETSRVVLRGQVEQAFSAELDGTGDAPCAARLDALEVALSWYTWDALSRVYGHERPAVVATMTETVRALLR
jgi:TetR/AcrR family transcriptional regulator, regulator of autoinduction and epiphytic fitness